MEANEIAMLLDSLCEGDENAFHTFLEVGQELIPLLIERFAETVDSQSRARIVEAIWQHRLGSNIPFLASALHDDDSEVWKQSLDGFVAIGGRSAYLVLQHELTTFPRKDIRIEWIEEAISQIMPIPGHPAP